MTASELFRYVESADKHSPELFDAATTKVSEDSGSDDFDHALSALAQWRAVAVATELGDSTEEERVSLLELTLISVAYELGRADAKREAAQ